ncbi:T6SS immunity phospholipase A1-binding lipoprotein Tli1-EAEC [Enterobacter cloacae]|uniref:T6SS immunity phospholipase A1-binding lipoprotein Tli1-EAEC n=1 Tax=Enterobacter cloacae TaxID=550 RepID=UPI000642B0C2|nr:T6SS immunity phospholipase A1-binding lipoprotein Tli1-EAEC [Enterobacter cloacae]EGQ5297313.1 T6SS immunity phospholipase A1-binding lipoprotein Tli1-EAEC [Enterobacter cloacae]EKS9205458.1 T6SS immunity phospholipase A1-binding lipoprotein Tli1-EAEC [Enterobacter cloacae]EKV5786912.1 T6SS immunity phospholipase A1-binding lipoprotein Tli1-EAEC [Enterobacter cloacae]EKX4007159.1 T6SS immunity phospholipase A1-binding lipoprotein Tli1-EAEC [Enterobacter cloacae]EKX4084663.1 T6SS immunity p
MTRVKLIFTALLLVSVTGCTAEKTSSLAPGETEWGYKKLPYDEWKFLFIYPKALPALATQALMVDGAGYKTTYEYIDTTRPSQVSVGRWNDHLGGTQAYYNKGKALPLMLRFCWDSVIDKKSYETLILFKKGTWEQMTTPYTDSRWDETYYRSTMIIGLAPEGKVSVWLGDRGNPVVPQSDAKITTVSGDKMQMCKGVTKSDFSYGYDQDIKEFIKGKSYPYGSW